MRKTIINRDAAHMNHLVISPLTMTTIPTLLSNHASQDIPNWEENKQLAFRGETRPLSTESLSRRRKEEPENQLPANSAADSHHLKSGSGHSGHRLSAKQDGKRRNPRAGGAALRSPRAKGAGRRAPQGRPGPGQQP